MNTYYLEVLDDALMDTDISNALFMESNTKDFFTKIKNTLNEARIKVKEYTILQKNKVDSEDGKSISKYQKGIEDRINHLLSMKSKNITSVDCYDYSKARKAFPNMLDALYNNINGTVIQDAKSKEEIDKNYKSFKCMINDFSDLLDTYTKETRLNVDTAIRILRDSDDSDSVENLSKLFSALNSLEKKNASLESNHDNYDNELYNYHTLIIRKAISSLVKFGASWIKTFSKNYDIEFSR